MNKEVESKLPESLLEVIGFEYDEESGDWNWASNDGIYTALVRGDDLKYVTIYEMERDPENEDNILDISTIFEAESLGDFIDTFILKGND